MYEDPYAAKNIDNAKEQEEIKKRLDIIASNIFTKEALQRLNNVKLVNENLTYNVISYVAQLYNAGKLSVVDEKMLISILKRNSKKREMKIVRR